MRIAYLFDDNRVLAEFDRLTFEKLLGRALEEHRSLSTALDEVEHELFQVAMKTP